MHRSALEWIGVRSRLLKLLPANGATRFPSREGPISPMK